ncbi:hormone-sensitive lipase isoform X1 [Schistocerca nitens]|uniref:hormone-sensitive lipase isoform X1 n=1 Tax=Schistocerca nitens TaxID=7011 RepID=UPI0021195DB1|nr:hormone-sensitive lipase isoform X1 [Schistocerca nitens]
MSSTKTETECLESSANVMYQALSELCKNNAAFFQHDDTESGQRLYAGFLAVMDHVEVVGPLVEKVRKVTPQYDLDVRTPGNGYRSFVVMVDSSVTHCMKLNKEICSSRDSILFRKSAYVRKVESCGQVLASLGTVARHIHTLLSWSPPGELFPADKHSPEELLRQAENVNMYCFYGYCLGLQFCESMRSCLKFISICMASFSEIYYGNDGSWFKAASSLWTGGKFAVDPELRARRIVNISQHASVDFCKSFWLLAETEIMARMQGVVGPSMAVNQVMLLPPEPLNVSGVAVPVPTAHFGPRPLPVRLLLARKRAGMVGSGATGSQPSSQLVVHLHGGGFVAQSSRSHASYLREWVARLDVPFLSVDYSLAPDAPFPRALEEALYAYCWARTHARMLGAADDAQIIMAGDSAGGNLCLGVTLKCLELGIPPPSGLFLAYVPVLLSFVPSPSRLLCLFDPLLPFGFMMRCLKAYTCGRADAESGAMESDLGDTESVCDDATDHAARESAASLSGNDTDTLTAGSLTSLQPECEQQGLQQQQQQHLPSPPLPSPPQQQQQQQQQQNNANESSRYVSEFLERYLGGEAGAISEQPIVQQHQNQQQQQQQQQTMTGHCLSQNRTTNHSRSPADVNPINMSLDSMMQRSPSAELCFTVPPDPLLSPYLTSDSILQKFPPVGILSVEMDPCLDDCVMFARKLRNLDVPVTLDVLPGLPHGFLNFSPLSKEAHSGSMLCVQRIQQLFDRASRSASPSLSPSSSSTS